MPVNEVYFLYDDSYPPAGNIRFRSLLRWYQIKGFRTHVIFNNDYSLDWLPLQKGFANKDKSNIQKCWIDYLASSRSGNKSSSLEIEKLSIIYSHIKRMKTPRNIIISDPKGKYFLPSFENDYITWVVGRKEVSGTTPAMVSFSTERLANWQAFFEEVISIIADLKSDEDFACAVIQEYAHGSPKGTETYEWTDMIMNYISVNERSIPIVKAHLKN